MSQAALEVVRALAEAWKARAAAYVALSCARAGSTAVDPLDDPAVQQAAQALFEARQALERAELACLEVAHG